MFWSRSSTPCGPLKDPWHYSFDDVNLWDWGLGRVFLVCWNKVGGDWLQEIFVFDLLCHVTLFSRVSSPCSWPCHPRLLYNLRSGAWSPWQDQWVCSFQNVFSMWKSHRRGNPSLLHIKRFWHVQFEQYGDHHDLLVHYLIEFQTMDVNRCKQ